MFIAPLKHLTVPWESATTRSASQPYVPKHSQYQVEPSPLGPEKEAEILQHDLVGPFAAHQHSHHLVHKQQYREQPAAGFKRGAREMRWGIGHVPQHPVT